MIRALTIALILLATPAAQASDVCRAITTGQDITIETLDAKWGALAGPVQARHVQMWDDIAGPWEYWTARGDFEIRGLDAACYGPGPATVSLRFIDCDRVKVDVEWSSGLMYHRATSADLGASWVGLGPDLGNCSLFTGAGTVDPCCEALQAQNDMDFRMWLGA